MTAESSRRKARANLRIIQLPRRFARESWGGTETVLLETSKCLLTMGHLSEIMCTDATATLARELIEGVQVSRYPYFYPYFGLSKDAQRRLDLKGGSPFSFALMRALNRVEAPDLFHLHALNRIGGIGRHVARSRGVPYVVSIHGGVFDVPAEEAAAWTAPARGSIEWGKVLGAWVGSRRVLRDAAAVICVGLPEQRLAQSRMPDQRVVYLPNGVDPERFARGDGERFRRAHQIPEDSSVILTVGRIDSQKNQLLAVRALSRLRAVDRNLRLLLVGPVTIPSYHDRVVAVATDTGVAEYVHLVPGLAPDDPTLVDAYHAADFFLLPSIHEPFGIVVLEAWAAGLPVVASRIGGVPHFVEDGIDGVLFDPAGGEDAVVAAFRRLHELGSVPLSEAGRRKVAASYTWSAITRRLVELYREVLEEHGATGS